MQEQLDDTTIKKDNDFVKKSGTHSLGPWPKSRDTRLFTYHNIIYKVRLSICPTKSSLAPVTPAANKSTSKLNSTASAATTTECPILVPDSTIVLKINNKLLQADIDRCIASLLKRPPTKAAPTVFKISTETRFTVELRSWKADPKFVVKMNNAGMSVHPYSFKVTGETTREFEEQPPPASSQSEGEQSMSEEGEEDSDSKEEQLLPEQPAVQNPESVSQPSAMTTSLSNNFEQVQLETESKVSSPKKRPFQTDDADVTESVSNAKKAKNHDDQSEITNLKQSTSTIPPHEMSQTTTVKQKAVKNKIMPDIDTNEHHNNDSITTSEDAMETESREEQPETAANDEPEANRSFLSNRCVIM